MEPMGTHMLVSWRDRALFQGSSCVVEVLFSDPAFSASSASSASSAVSAVLRCEQQTVSTAERAELRGEGMEPMRAQVLCSGAIGRRSRFHHEAWEYGSVTLLSLRSYVANDKRSLPQSAQSCGEKDMEPMRAQVLCSGAIGRRSRFHHAAWEYGSVTRLSLRPLRSYVANDKRSLPQSAQSLWGEGHGADEGPGPVFWRHRPSFQVSS